MARISPAVKLTASIVVLLGAIVLAVALAIVPVYVKAGATSVSIASEKANLSTEQSLVERRQTVKAQSAATEAEIIQLTNKMPETIRVPLLIIDIYELGKSCAVKLPVVSVGEPGAPGAGSTADPAGAADANAQAPSAGAGFSAVPVNLSARGNWSDLMEFHRRVRDMYRSARVKSSTITYVEAAEGSPAYINADMTIEFYLSGTASSTATSTAAAPATTGS